ncbi:MAG: alpha/beta hydrolase [Verrucomicrobiota bacterium]
MKKLFGYQLAGWKGVLLRLLVVYPMVIYVTLLLMITFMRESLVYPGASTFQHLRLDNPVFHNAVEEKGLELWKAGDGSYLGLKHTVENPEMRWLVFYGNGDVGLRASGWFSGLQGFMPDRKCDFYIMEYPGYGPQSGKPGEQAIVDQAKLVAAELPDDELPVYFFGQSMGAGVVCRLITEPEWKERIDGLLLVNPYTSLVGASYQYLKSLVGPFSRFFPVERIQPDRFESVTNIKAFEGRVVIIAGELDTLTPAWMAEELQQQVPGESRLWIQKGVGHWTDPEPYSRWRELMDFLIGSVK